MHRTFGKIEKGSLRLAILTLINTAVGAGMMSLSQAIAQFGYVIGFLMYFVGAGNLYMGLYCFKYLMFKYENVSVYSDLVKEVLGKKFESLLNYIFIIYVFGTLIAYVLVTEKLIWGIFSKYDVFQKKKETVDNIIYFILLILSCILNLAKNADDIKKISKFSLVIIFYITIVLVAQISSYVSFKKPEYEPVYFNSLKDWISSYGCFIYSFNCIVNIFLVKAEMKNKTKMRLGKIFRRTTLFILVFYIIIGFSGYLSFGQDSKKIELILLRESLPDSLDLWMQIGLALISIQTFIGYITHVIPIKQQIVGYMGIEYSFKVNLTLTLLLTFLSVSLAYYYPHCKDIFSLLGLFFGTSIITIFPGTMMCRYIYTQPEFKLKKFLFFLSWTVIIGAVGIFCGVYKVYSLFAK